jgi:hypothetical protein
MPKRHEKPSALIREHPALQNIKILYFFLFLWVIFALLDPDPDPATQIYADPCESGSETLVYSLCRTLWRTDYWKRGATSDAARRARHPAAGPPRGAC